MKKKSRAVRKIPLTTFSAGVLVDEHTWKAPFSWGSIFAGPTVKVCIHRDKILHIYSQHYFIIMLSTPPPKTKTVQNGENSFSSTRTRRPHQRSKNFLPNGFLVGIYNELPQYGTPICVCVCTHASQGEQLPVFAEKPKPCSATSLPACYQHLFIDLLLFFFLAPEASVKPVSGPPL